MKKVLLVFLSLAVCFLVVFIALRGGSYLLINALFEDCGNRDWSVELPYGYEIVKINSKRIILINNTLNSASNIVISEYINAYRYNEQFLEVLCARDGPDDLLSVDREDDMYFLIEFEKRVLYGPYSNEEFINHCFELSIPEMGDWLTTKPRPQNAMFSK